MEAWNRHEDTVYKNSEEDETVKVLIGGDIDSHPSHRIPGKQ